MRCQLTPTPTSLLAERACLHIYEHPLLSVAFRKENNQVFSLLRRPGDLLRQEVL